VRKSGEPCRNPKGLLERIIFHSIPLALLRRYASVFRRWRDDAFKLCLSGREGISRERVDAANQLRHDEPARRVVKQAHWLLLRNPANVKTPALLVRLDEVLAANPSQMI
jgi:hypothetical protein